MPNFVRKSKQPGVLMREKVEFLHLFLSKEEVSGFQANRDLRHTKLGLHAKFRRKKLEAKDRKRCFCVLALHKFSTPLCTTFTLCTVMERGVGGNSVSKNLRKRLFLLWRKSLLLRLMKISTIALIFYRQ